MKSMRSRLWIIILGGVLGLALGIAVSYFAVSNHWERLSYPALAPDKDRAIELSGYDSYDGTLYVKGQSQALYGCPADLYRENTDCHRVTTGPKLVSCPIGGLQPADALPGKVISELIVFDCRYNNYFIVQTNYIILDDGSLMKWTYNNFSEGLQNCLIIPGAIFGMVLGLIVGAIFAATRKNPRSSA